MTGDGSVLGDDHDGDLVDDLVEELRRLDPVDVETLPSSRSPEAMRTLEGILDGSGGAEPELQAEDEPEDEDELEAELEDEDEAEPEAEADESSPSPAAGDRGGREEPPPRPTPR